MITSSFYHESHGNVILGESLTSIGLCGFGEEAYPIKIETDEILKSSEEEVKVPSWNDFLDVKDENDLKNLKLTWKKKVKSFAYLPPFFTEVLLDLKNIRQRIIY